MFKNITLELSLKPFKKTDDKYISAVCRQIFRQWYPLLKNRGVISVMLWTADGSEILDYSGVQSDSFEWCRFVGTANRELAEEKDRPDTSIHEKKRLYISEPPVMTYGILKKIVSALKREGKLAFPDSEITVGETFDIGPEFAVSDFKYRRHKEICTGSVLDRCGFVDSTALLHADSYCYAAYPNGIPEGTPFGLFLGRQAEIFLKDMGFDYLWLSNGLGFSADPWSMNGKIFDGEAFYPEKLENTVKSVFEFWNNFRSGCPDFPIAVRGTNNTVGIDYASDGVPLYAIYNGGFNISSPPNSPWAALNDDFGLELMGHMTRICGYPGNEFMFRFYIHDPWWINSPWYDRYNENPHDIYLPMSVSRINSAGETEGAGALNILSIDNSFGDMPDCCVNEPLPHILKAERNLPDEAAPFVLVYPMREYTTSQNEAVLKEMYYGDKYMCDAVNSGFPLNCVVSTDNFLETPAEVYSKSIIISPAPLEENVKIKLEKLEKSGIPVIYYSGESFKKQLPDNSLWLDIAKSPTEILNMIKSFGYELSFNKLSEKSKNPVLTASRSNNGFYISVYSPDTTTEALIRFPLGAPVFSGGETEIRNGCAVYHFARSEHRECRIFINQRAGVVGAKEVAPVSPAIHRIIKLSGLENASVYFFPERNYSDSAKAGKREYDCTPEYDNRWKTAYDKKYGAFLYAENVSGEINLFMLKK